MATENMEKTILDQAVNAFQQLTGQPLRPKQRQARAGNPGGDVLLELPAAHADLAVEVKRWAPQANPGALAEQVKRLPVPGILVADYINPNMADKLKALEVQFIDTAGNAYINQPPVFVWVTGNRQVVAPQKRNRAFDAAGLKVIYGFLCAPGLVNATYREIAKVTDVALGTVGWVINGLKDAGFIAGRNTRRLENGDKLLERWVDAYPQRLKPGLLVGYFDAPTDDWWKTADLAPCNGYWGGEIAAKEYVGYLKPAHATVYVPAGMEGRFIAEHRLRKAQDPETAPVTLCRPFWAAGAGPTHGGGKNVVHPILAYADLLATADSRNLEAARMLYETHIAGHLGQD